VSLALRRQQQQRFHPHRAVCVFGAPVCSALRQAPAHGSLRLRAQGVRGAAGRGARREHHRRLALHPGACTRRAQPVSQQPSDNRAQIDPGTLTFCTSVSYVSCLRMPVPATYDKLVSDVRKRMLFMHFDLRSLLAAFGRHTRCVRRDLAWSSRRPGVRFARPRSSRTFARLRFPSASPSTASTLSCRCAGLTAFRARRLAPAPRWQPRRAPKASRHEAARQACVHLNAEPPVSLRRLGEWRLTDLTSDV